jgi:hypothetical protein
VSDERKQFRLQIILTALPVLMSNSLKQPQEVAQTASAIADAVEAEEQKRE